MYESPELLEDLPSSGTDTIQAESAEIFAAAKADPNFLSALAMPTVYEFAWPPVLMAVWFWLVQVAEGKERLSRLALGLPRGFGKTTLVKLFILYCILFTKRKFILILSSTSGHACNIIADIVDMLDDPNIRAVFGNWRAVKIEKDTQDVKKFHFRGRDIILAGIGAGGSVRGLNMKNSRPDVMVFEDAQTREDADSQVVSEALYKWMLGTAMKAKDPKGCMMLFIANMYPTPHSILKKLKGNPFWTKFIAGGIRADGTSLWEELHPIETLLTEYEADVASGHAEIFNAEVLNDENASVNNLVDLSAIPAYPYEDDDIAAGKFIVIDPATDKVNADALTIMGFEVHDMRPVCRHIDEGRFSPGDTIRRTITMCMETGTRLVAIESNAYQSTLKYWSEFICAQMGIVGITFVEIYSGKSSKVSRILNMFKSYMKAEILVHPSCASLVNTQITSFNPLRADNSDGILDCLAYGPRVMNEFSNVIGSYTIEAEQVALLDAMVPYSEHDNSPF